MSDRERFLEAREQIRALLRSQPVGSAGTRTVRDVLREMEEQAFAMRRAEALISEALVVFPLHPSLLCMRANARLRIMDRTGATPQAAPAYEDLTLAAEVAPDYLEPPIELAHFTSVHLDDDHAAAELFERLIERAANILCHCVAARVKTLVFDDQRELARDELARWTAVFPSNAELRAAADMLP